MIHFSNYFPGPIWGLSELFLFLLKRSKSGAVTRDGNSLGWLWFVNLSASALAVVIASIWPEWKLPLQGWLYWAGCFSFAGGIALRWYSIFHLGRLFTVHVTIAKDHQLIRSGPYRWMRHPSYTGMLLMVLGFGLCMGNIISILVLMVPCTWVCLKRIRIEEEVLRHAFAQQYLDYMKATKRLIPFAY